MTNDVNELPSEEQELTAIIRRQRDELSRRESALAIVDVHIEQLRHEATNALAAVASRDQEIARQRDELARHEAELAQRAAAIEQIKREAADQIAAERQRHKAEMDALLRRFYGPRSERFNPTQLLLFGQLVDQMPIDEKSVEQEAGEKLVTRRAGGARARHNHGRSKLPESLPRQTIEHDLSDQQKACTCCGQQRDRIGSEDSEQLEYIPSSLTVLHHVRHKYACKHCSEGCHQCDASGQIQIAAKPPQPIEKGLAGPGLLAYVAVSKHADHLPLYRLEQIFARQEVTISRSTMCGWMMAMSVLVKPLYELMIDRVKKSVVIHTDETTVPVQDDQVKGQCKKGRIWTYLGDRDNPYVVYDYTPDRTRAGPAKFLAGYKGYLQADAYSAYDGIYVTGVTEVACWAHARRKFFDAKGTDGRRSAEMLTMVGELYAIEKAARELDDAGRLALRQSQSKPILEKIKAWLDAESKLVLPRSPMALAMQYTLNQWDALCVYTTAGMLNIDNNAAERALKRIAIGRRNWLFAGNDAFGRVGATLSTLIASAQRHGLDPQRYLMSVLAKIGQTQDSEVKQFLPDVWKAELLAEAERLKTKQPSGPTGAALAVPMSEPAPNAD